MDYRITIDVLDVGRGDVVGLVSAILNEHGYSFDADRGDFKISVSEKQGDNFFSIDALGEE